MPSTSLVISSVSIVTVRNSCYFVLEILLSLIVLRLPNNVSRYLSTHFKHYYLLFVLAIATTIISTENSYEGAMVIAFHNQHHANLKQKKVSFLSIRHAPGRTIFMLKFKDNITISEKKLQRSKSYHKQVHH